MAAELEGSTRKLLEDVLEKCPLPEVLYERARGGLGEEFKKL